MLSVGVLEFDLRAAVGVETSTYLFGRWFVPAVPDEGTQCFSSAVISFERDRGMSLRSLSTCAIAGFNLPASAFYLCPSRELKLQSHPKMTSPTKPQKCIVVCIYIYTHTHIYIYTYT